MIRNLVIFPDDRLITVCSPVTEFDKKLQTLVEDLFATMYHYDGIGLAAPQVGVLLNVFVIDCRRGKKPYNPVAFINPHIVSSTSTFLTEDEGCLSIPGVFLPVPRPARVGFSSRGLRGEYLSGDLRGLEARAFFHEYDHTLGVLFTSKAVAEAAAVK